MKRYFFIIVWLCALGVLAGCGEKNGSSDGTEGGAVKKIEALVEDGSSFNDRIDEVRVLMYSGEGSEAVEVATGTYANGGFVIELPATVENSLLESDYFGMNEMPPSFTISGNENAMVGDAELRAYKSGVEVGDLYYYYESETRESEGYLIYIDSDLSISGSYTGDDDGEKYTISASVALKKGWNFGYESYEETAGGEYKSSMSTTAPSGLKWYFISNGSNPGDGGDGIGDDPSVVKANGVANADPRIATVRVSVGEGLGMKSGAKMGMSSKNMMRSMRSTDIKSALRSIRALSRTGSLKAAKNDFGSSSFNGGQFTIDLPTPLDESYLLPITEGMPSGISVSNPNTMGVAAAVLACDDAGNAIGVLLPVDINRMCVASYVYVDRNCTISGSYDGAIFNNCSFNTGWNFMYMSVDETEETVIYTTQKPQGVNLQWMYMDASQLK